MSKYIDLAAPAIPATAAKLFGQTDAGAPGWIDGDKLILNDGSSTITWKNASNQDVTLGFSGNTGNSGGAGITLNRPDYGKPIEVSFQLGSVAQWNIGVDYQYDELVLANNATYMGGSADVLRLAKPASLLLSPFAGPPDKTKRFEISSGHEGDNADLDYLIYLTSGYAGGQPIFIKGQKESSPGVFAPVFEFTRDGKAAFGSYFQGISSSAYLEVLNSAVIHKNGDPFLRFVNETPTTGKNWELKVIGATNEFGVQDVSQGDYPIKINQGAAASLTISRPLNISASTAAANTASLKIPAGVVATTPVSGNIESDGTHLYWTNSSGTRIQLDN